MLAPLFKQVVGELEEDREGIEKAYGDQKKVIGGRGLT